MNIVFGFLSFYNAARGCVCFVVVFDSRDLFYLAYACVVSHIISCADDVGVLSNCWSSL